MTTYYIDWTTGNDSNNGISSGSAWKSWYHLNATRAKSASFNAGDEFLFKRGETFSRADYYTEYPSADNSGSWRFSPDVNLTLGAYGSGSLPIIDVADANTNYVYGIYIGYNSAPSGSILEYLKFTNSVSSTADYRHMITSHVSVNNVEVRYCEFDVSNESSLNFRNETISMGGNYIYVHHNNFLGVGTNRHACYLGGSHNRMMDNIARGFGLTGFKLNGDIASGSVVARNLAIDCGYGVDVAEAEYCDVFSNIIISTSEASWGYNRAIQFEDDNPADGQYPRYNKVYNNTIIVNRATHASRIITHIKSGDPYDDWASGQTNEFKNNIVFGYSSSFDLWYHHMDTNIPKIIECKNNLYYGGSTTGFYHSGSELTYAQWTALDAGVSIHESGSYNSDPSFASHSADSIDPSDYILSVGSDAIDGAISITLNNSEPFTDYYGNTFTTDDIGAIAYGLYTGATYYVDGDNGDDDRSSAQAQNPYTPWKTYYNFNHTRGEALLNPGDTIKFKAGTTIRRTDTPIDNAGTPGQYSWAWRDVNGVTVTTYLDADNPNNTGITMPTNAYESKNTTNRVVIDGVGCNAYANGRIAIRNTSHTDLYNIGYAQSGDGYSNTFIGINFTTSINITYNDADSYLVILWKLSGTTSDSTSFINCEIDGSLMEEPDNHNEMFTCNASNLLIDLCWIHGNPNWASDQGSRSGPYFAGDSNVVKRSTIENIWMSGLRLGSGTYSQISQCLVIDAGTGIHVVPTQDYANIFSNVIIYTGAMTASAYLTAIQPSSPWAIGIDEGATYNKIYNNTIIYNGETGTRTAGGIISDDIPSPTNEVKNNIVFIYNGDGRADVEDHWFAYNDNLATTNTMLTASNNLYFKDVGTTVYLRNGSFANNPGYGGWDDVENTLAEWQSGLSGTESGSIEGDADFTNHSENSKTPSDYTLGTGSLAIGAGTSVTLYNSEALVDFHGNSFITNDIGAFAFTGSIYYVDSGSGNDSNNGVSTGSAWKSYYAVNGNTSLKSGDTVLFKKGYTYYCTGSVGDNTAPFYSPTDGLNIGAYDSGARPIISGNGKNAAFRMTDTYERDNITIEGLEFRDGRTVSGVIGSTAYENGFTFAYSGDGLTLIDCLFDGTSSFENCIIGKSTITGGASNYIIQNCTFQNAQMRAGLYLTGIGGLLVESCSFLNNHGYDTYETSSEGSGLKINHGGSDHIIRNNWFENNHFGFRCGSATGSFFYNNIIIGEEVPILNGACVTLTDPDDGNDISELKIYYNTFITKQSAVQNFGIYGTGGPTGIDFRNNITYHEGGGAGTEYLFQFGTSQAAIDTLDYNLSYSPNSDVRWAHLGITSTPYGFVTNWQGEAGYDINGVNSNTYFSNYAGDDFTLSANSAAIGAATPVTDENSNPLLVDYLGNARSATVPDAGAYEYTGSLYTGSAYYLDSASGSDSNDGLTHGNAWETFNKVSEFTFSIGDGILLCRGSTFSHSVTYTHSGTYSMIKVNTGSLSFDAYDGYSLGTGTGSLPIISGETSDYAPINWVGSFGGGGRDNISFKNIKFFHCGDSPSTRTLLNIEDSNYITIEDCWFDADHVYTTGKKVSCITSNYNTETSDYWTIRNNLIENTTPSDMSVPRDNEHGIYMGGSNSLIEFNTVRNIYGQGIYHNAATAQSDVIVRYNWIENTGDGIADCGTIRSLIHDNVIITSDGSFEGSSTGFLLRSDWSNNPTYPRQSFDGKCYNNTIIIKTPAASKYTYGIKFSSGTTGDPIDSFDIKNNIFYAETATRSSYLRSTAVSLTLPTFDNNLYFAVSGTPNWLIDDPSFDTASFSGWQSHTTSPDVNGVSGDPVFSNYSSDNFNILSSSAGLNEGATIYNHATESITLDYPQNTRIVPYDIGAYEYISSASGSWIIYGITNFSKFIGISIDQIRYIIGI